MVPICTVLKNRWWFVTWLLLHMYSSWAKHWTAIMAKTPVWSHSPFFYYNKIVKFVSFFVVCLFILSPFGNLSSQPTTFPEPHTHRHIIHTSHKGNQWVFLLSVASIRLSETLTSISPTLHLLRTCTCVCVCALQRPSSLLWPSD